MIKQEIHIVGGLNRDTSKMNYDNNSVFDARNIRITTREDGNELLSVTNEKSPTEALEYNVAGETKHIEIKGDYVGHCVSDDGVVIFSSVYRPQNSSEKDFITYYKYDKQKEEFEKGRILFMGDANFSTEYPLETLFLLETDSIKKVYWTDGVNQPRVINICKENTITDSDELNFSRAAIKKDKSSCEIERMDSGGSFAPGTIIYAFSYFNKNAQETRLFKISEMYYTSYIDRGEDVTAKISNSFKITLKNLNSEYDYVRVYSINRSSANDVPLCKIVGDYKVTDSLTLIDTNTTGQTIAPSDLFYVGGIYFTAETLEQKDNTLFLGNIKKKTVDVKLNWENMHFDPIYVDYNNKPIFLPIWENNVLSYKDISGRNFTSKIPLHFPEKETTDYYKYELNNNRSSRQSKRFKYNEFYKLGVLLELENGEFSDVYPINIVRNIYPPKTFIKSAYSKDTTRYEYYPFSGGETLNISEEDKTAAVEKTYLTGAFRGIIYNKDGKLRESLIENKVKRIYPVVCYPTENYRSVICQGVLSPTLYNVNKRDSGSAFSINSPRFKFLSIGEYNSDNIQLPTLVHNMTLEPSISMRSEIQNQTLGSKGLWVKKSFKNLTIEDILPSKYIEKFELNYSQFYDEEYMQYVPLLMEDYNGITWERSFLDANFKTSLNGPAAKKIITNQDGTKSLSLMDKADFINKYKDQFFMDGSILSLNAPELEQGLLKDYFANESRGDIKLRIVGFSNIVDTECFKETQFKESINNPTAYINSAHGTYLELNNKSNISTPTVIDTYRFHLSKSILNTIGIPPIYFPYAWGRNYDKHASWDWQQGSMTFGRQNNDGDVFNEIKRKINANFWYGNSFYEAFNNIDLDLDDVNLFDNDGNQTTTFFKSNGESKIYTGQIDETFQTIQRFPKSIQSIIENDFNDYGLNTTATIGRNITGYILPEFVYLEDSSNENLTPFNKNGNHDTTSGFNMPQMFCPFIANDEEESQYDINITASFSNDDQIYYLKRKGLYAPYRGSSIPFASTKISFHAPSHCILSLSTTNDIQKVISSTNTHFYASQNRDCQPFWKNNYGEESFMSENVLPYQTRYSGAVGLCIGEIYRSPESLNLNVVENTGNVIWDSNTWMGGKSQEHLLEWVICGNYIDVEDLGEEAILYYLEGDSYFERYDCLKTYPFNEAGSSTVEVFSTLIESRVNLDHKLDKIRGPKGDVVLSSITEQTFNRFNLSGYNQQNNFFNYRAKNETIIEESNFPTQITWSLEKHYGENIDTWTSIDLTNLYDLNGEYGQCTALEKFNNNIYAFQEKALSVVAFNERVSVPTSDNNPIQITNGYKMNGVQYMSSNIGCQNKWSIVSSDSGLYFIDNNNKNIMKVGSNGLENISSNNGLKSYVIQNNTLRKWNPEKYSNFRAFKDTVNNDIYFSSRDEMLSYNEQIGKFTSFFDYDNTLALFNINDKTFSIHSYTIFNKETEEETKYTKLYKMFSGDEYGCLYNKEYKPYSVTLLSKGEPTFDKIFNTIDWRDEYGTTEEDALETFDSIQASNAYQDSEEVLFDKKRHGNLRKFFNVWRANIPRDKKHKRDRIRNVDAFIKLTGKPSEKKNKKHLIKNFIISYKM